MQMSLVMLQVIYDVSLRQFKQGGAQYFKHCCVTPCCCSFHLTLLTVCTSAQAATRAKRMTQILKLRSPFMVARGEVSLHAVSEVSSTATLIRRVGCGVGRVVQTNDAVA
jgi:hypothetical protein